MDGTVVVRSVFRSAASQGTALNFHDVFHHIHSLTLANTAHGSCGISLGVISGCSIAFRIPPQFLHLQNQLRYFFIQLHKGNAGPLEKMILPNVQYVQEVFDVADLGPCIALAPSP